MHTIGTVDYWFQFTELLWKQMVEGKSQLTTINYINNIILNLNIDPLLFTILTIKFQNSFSCYMCACLLFYLCCWRTCLAFSLQEFCILGNCMKSSLIFLNKTDFDWSASNGLSFSFLLLLLLFLLLLLLLLSPVIVSATSVWQCYKRYVKSVDLKLKFDINQSKMLRNDFWILCVARMTHFFFPFLFWKYNICWAPVWFFPVP